MKNLLNPKWLLVINTLPIAVLFFIFLSDYNIIKSLLSEESISLWKKFGLALLIISLINLGYTITAIISKKSVSIYYCFISLVVYISYIYAYNYNASDIIPSDIPRWLFSGNLLVYVGTFLMPTLIYALFIIVIKLTSSNKDHKAWQNFLISISIPLVWYIFFQLIMPFWRLVDNGYSEHALIIGMVTGVILFLFFLIRGIYILSIKKDIAWKKYQLVWKIPIAILFPILGLLVNQGFIIDRFNETQSGIFGNFNSYWFYIIALVNGILICLPNLENKTYRLALYAGRSITLAYTLYFFIVFLPFLPFSIIAIIAIGVGFLMLTPLVLFVIHIQELVSDYSFLKHYVSKQLLVAISVIGFLVIPTSLVLSYQQDRVTLHNTLDYIYSPNYSKQYNIDKTSLKKTLNVVSKNKSRDNDFILGKQTPYLSSIFNWIVLDNLTLSDTKINTIKSIFFAKEYHSPRQEFIRNENVNISNISSNSTYNKTEDYWETWVDLEITNANTNNFFSEYATTIDLPNGCWINDYYLYVGDKKEMGILAEKKSAMWVFSQIRNENRDPGLLHYLTGNKVSFRVFPFAENEVRKTGIKFIHKEPIKLNIDNHKITLGDTTTQTKPNTTKNDYVAYVSSAEKQNLETVKRQPYYHFIVDVSAGKANLKDSYKSTIETFLEKNPLNSNHKISFTNSYTNTTDFNPDWKTTLRAQTFEGGFYLERGIKEVLYDSYTNLSNTYPIIITVTDNMLGAIIAKDFKDFKMTFPESDVFYHLNTLGYLASHSLTNKPRKLINDDVTIDVNNHVLAWPNTSNPKAYLPNNKESNIVLKSFNFEINDTEIKSSDWNSGLLLQGKWLSNSLHPETSENNWNDQVKHSFMSKIMTPYTSYIVVENEAQKAILKKKQKEVLSGKKSLDLNEETQQMSEPELILLFILFGLFLLYKNRKLKFM